MLSDLEILGIVLGAALTIIFTGYIALAEYSDKGKGSYSRPQTFAGAITALFGMIMLGAWIYFLMTARESLMKSFSMLIAHVALELFSALALIGAGVYILLGRRKGPALLMTAYGLLIFTQVFSVVVYGPMGHPFLMNGLALILLIVLTYFIGLVYAWEHFVLGLDQSEKHSKRKS